ncbi:MULTISPECIES: helix-turn-helix domain-containing protein [Bacteria]|uniref:helix-turn-helix domain-containing protein n=1 Tax=Bacteria TaxID=2 RepID=UPI003C7AC5C7
MSPAELRSIREQVGYSIEDLARALSKSRSIIQKWEAGKAPIPGAVAGDIEAMQDDYQDDLEKALARAESEIIVWPGPLDDDSWDATGRPSRWWRQIAAQCRQEHGSRIIYRSEPVHVPHDPMSLLEES